MLAENVTFNTPDWIHRKIRATLIETLRKCNTLTPNEPPISARHYRISPWRSDTELSVLAIFRQNSARWRERRHDQFHKL